MVWSQLILYVVLALVSVSASTETRKPPAAGIASTHPLATEAGQAILFAGGNAFDAAVSVSAVLAVVEPYSSGLGGGGFWLLHRARDGKQVMLDGREKAPAAAHRDLFLDSEGKFLQSRSIDGALAAGIPGEPAALVHLAENYGRLPLAQTLEPAIRLARDGFRIDPHFRRMATWRLQALRQSSAAAKQFLDKGDIPKEGHLLRQPDLAATLGTLSEQGRPGFYLGALAQKLVSGVVEAGGIWTLDDLANYRVVERAPLTGSYRGVKIVSAAPPSSGGVLLLQMLNMLSGFDLEKLEPIQVKHLTVEAMRRAYRDRAAFLGDPDFVSMPIERLIHPFYAYGLARDIQLGRATPHRPVAAPVNPLEGADTTHFSIIDTKGNRVAATLSINYPFGSGFVAPGTGVLLNDEMDDFSARPGAPNVYGLIGGAANAVAPGKRMLSSMSPTFIETDERVVVLGTPGGSRIITMVLQGILQVLNGGGPLDWVAAPRFHHQYLPDKIQFESGAFSDDEIGRLRAMGHVLEAVARPYGNMQVVSWDKGLNQVTAASDPRGTGAAAVR